MNQPYHMVIINVVAFLFVLICFGLFLYFFPKKKIHYFLWLLVLSFLPLLSIFRSGGYESGDMSLHVVRTISFFHSLQEGLWLPHWAGELNALYGYPLFIYIYPLPYYLAAFFHFLGFGFIDSIKCLLIVSFIVSGVTMYLFLKDVLGEIAAFVGSIFYIFSPYHLMDMQFRVDIGETLSFVFMPLIFYGLKRQFTDTKFRWKLLTIFSLSGLLLSHQAVSLLFFPFAVSFVFLLFFTQKKRIWINLLSVFLSLLLGILCTAFYIVPVLWESRITHQARESFVAFFPFWSYIFSPWQFGFLFQGHKGELSFVLGYTQILVIVLAFVLLYDIAKPLSKFITPLKNQHNKLLVFSMSAFLILFLMMQSFSSSLWQIIPLIKNFQFSYRLMGLIVFFVSIIAAIVVRSLPKKLIFLLCILTILYPILNWGNRRVVPEITDAVLAKTLPESSSRVEGLFPAMPVWVDRKHPFMSKRPNAPIDLLTGSAAFKVISHTSTEHEYIISVSKSARLKENTLYYPGWMVMANGKRLPISYISSKYPGIIQFSLPKGKYSVRVYFGETADRMAGLWISGIVFFFLLVSTVFYFVRKKL